MTANTERRLRKWNVICFLSLGYLVVFSNICSFSQEMPPRPVSVSLNQNLSFGAFYPGVSGGTVTITSTGVRFAIGSVILVEMGYLYFPAVFLLEGNPGTIVHLLNGPDATLTGSNGGSMTLHLGESTPGDPIIINAAPPDNMQIKLGGVLEVGNQLSNPPGYYNGVFSLMFIQE